jgi:hypothetical protein
MRLISDLYRQVFECTGCDMSLIEGAEDFTSATAWWPICKFLVLVVGGVAILHKLQPFGIGLF